MKSARTIILAALALPATLILFLLVCCIIFGPRYIGRYVFWNVSDIEDYKRFPYHDVRNEPPAFHFDMDLQEDSVRSLLNPLEYKYGGDTQKLGNLEQFLEAAGTTAFIVIKDDAILYEGYFNGYARDSINTSFSVAKSFASTLIGIAIDEGHIESVDDPIINYLPQLKGRDMDSVTIRHLLMMSSGFEYPEKDLPAEIDLPWAADVATYYSLDLRKTALTVVPEEGPGRHFRYNNYHPLLLGMILENTTQKSVAAYLEEKIWKPRGMEYPASWSIDSEESGFAKMESGINARAIDFAKMGRLFLRKGDWDGKRIISERWVEESTTRDTTVSPDYYSLPGWWISFFESGKGYYKYMWWGYARDDDRYDFFADGHLGQYIYVRPDAGLIIIRNGKTRGAVDSWRELLYDMADRL